MRKTLLTILMLVLAVTSVDAQVLNFSKRHIQRQRETRKARMEQVVTNDNTPSYAKGATIGEYTEIIDDGAYDETRYRYVYSYDENYNRVSEAVYMTVKEGEQWGAESFLTLGTYTYGYDTEQRINLKKVEYDPEPFNVPGDIASYYIMITYNNDGTTTYTKYTKLDDEYYLDTTWSYYDNGALASCIIHVDTDGYAINYNEDGDVTMWQGSSYRKSLFSGNFLTSKQMMLYNNYSDNWECEGGTYYEYNPDALALTQYQSTAPVDAGESNDIYYKAQYDDLGRIINVVWGVRGADSNVEILDEIAFTYFNDEVYGVGNSWHDVIGFEGPVSKLVYVDYDGNEDDNYSITFNRDNTGKLLSATSSQCNLEVDSNGRLTEWSFNDGYSQYYTWQGDNIVKRVCKDLGVLTSTSEYQFSDGGYSAKWWEYNDYTDDSDTYYYVGQQKTDNKIVGWERRYIDGVVDEYDDYYNLDYVIEVQQEDVSFIRPCINLDYDQMAPHHPNIISKAGRVACVVDGQYIEQNDINFMAEVGTWRPFNLVPNMLFKYDGNYKNDPSIPLYYSVEHEGDKVVCSNFEGLPVYVLKDGLLIQEYIYREPEHSNIGGGVSTMAEVPAGQPYDLITYLYDDNGNLVGRNSVSVDENGTTTEEVSVEYKYVTTALESIEVDAAPSAMLNGRTLGFSDNESFTIYTLDGRMIVANATSFTLPSSGIYIVLVSNHSLKLLVK